MGHTTLFLLTFCQPAKSQVGRAPDREEVPMPVLLAGKEPPWGSRQASSPPVLCKREKEATAAAPVHPWGQARCEERQGKSLGYTLSLSPSLGPGDILEAKLGTTHFHT